MEHLHRGPDQGGQGGSSSETATPASEPAAPGRGSSPAHAGGTIWRKAVVTTRDGEGDAPRDHFAAATQGASSEVPYRAEMERSFGHDFSGVRAYLGRAAPMAAIGAEAATRGEQIAFATATPARDLVAHELTHVVQSRQHGGGGVQLKEAVSSPSHAAEHEADAVAERVVRGERVTVGAAPSAEVARRGPIYTGVSEQLGEYQLPANTPVVILDDIDHVELERRSHSGETVRVRYAPDQQPQVFRDVPAKLLDIKTYFVSKDDLHDNPDNGAHAQSQFKVPPRAISIGTGDLVVEIELETRNRWDRASWAIELEAPGKKPKRLEPNTSWWNNPAWKPDEMNANSFHSYRDFKPDFTGFPAHGRGEVGHDRKIYAHIPEAELHDYFGNDLCESSKIVVGMNVRYDGNKSPVTVDETEFAQAFGMTGQYHGEGVFRTRSDGYVDLSALSGKLKPGDWATDKEVWQQPLQPEPRPNLLRAYPGSYVQNHKEMSPLAPVGSFPQDGMGNSKLEMATRIENEATLHLSNLKALKDLVMVLEGLVGKDEEISAIMKQGGHPLSTLRWSLHKENEGKPMVFTDKYLDDPGMRALRSGVGIRRRHTTKATKLNVKTGEGHRVGMLKDLSEKPGHYSEYGGDDEHLKSDIYRRHEIGFDLNPQATPQDIREYLRSGLGGKDPWNKSGDEANRTVRENLRENLDYAQLDYRMVLQGHRTKFKLSAVGEDGGTINIEISCDHTLGRTYENYMHDGGDDVDPTAAFNETEGRYKHIYNIEMELEHLGAGKTNTNESPPQPRQPSTPSSSNDTRESEPSTSAPILDLKRAQPGHPGRMYLRDDTHAPEFNTPSFQVFARAQQRFVEFARNEAKIPRGGSSEPIGLLNGEQGEDKHGEDKQDDGPRGIGPDQLGKAPQKLEALYKMLEGELLPGGVPEHQPIRLTGTQYKPSMNVKRLLGDANLRLIEIDADGDCLYDAVIKTAKLGFSIQVLRNMVADEVRDNSGHYRGFMTTESVDTVIGRIRQMGSYAGVDGDIAPAVIGKICKLAITILNPMHVTPPQSSGTPIMLVRYAGTGPDHFDGTRPV